MAAGVVEGVMFLGRQVGHTPASGADRWWGWLGVWPLVIALALTTFAVICFPDGRLPSPRWRPVAAAIVVVALGLATLSAIWPVEYASAGVVSTHPFNAETPGAVARLATVTHPAYFALQVLWVLALVVRWRSADGNVRRQLAWVAAAAAVSVTDLAAQGALVIDHLNLSHLIARQRQAGHLEGLSPREREVLELMARGLSNSAICDELHLSIKTVEPVVSAIFTKLGLYADATSNRRVLAVLAFVRT